MSDRVRVNDGSGWGMIGWKGSMKMVKLIVMGVKRINESGKTDCDGGGRDQ